eukprot:5032700-Prymnesium_polylepis.1
MEDQPNSHAEGSNESAEINARQRQQGRDAYARLPKLQQEYEYQTAQRTFAQDTLGRPQGTINVMGRGDTPVQPTSVKIPPPEDYGGASLNATVRGRRTHRPPESDLRKKHHQIETPNMSTTAHATA